MSKFETFIKEKIKLYEANGMYGNNPTQDNNATSNVPPSTSPSPTQVGGTQNQTQVNQQQTNQQQNQQQADQNQQQQKTTMTPDQKINQLSQWLQSDSEFVKKLETMMSQQSGQGQPQQQNM